MKTVPATFATSIRPRRNERLPPRCASVRSQLSIKRSSPAPASIPPVGATMVDFANRGLTSSSDFDQPCGVLFGCPCAFPGINPNVPPLPFFESIGRSVYNGLQIKLTGNVQHAFRGLRTLNFQISYALSRFENAGGSWPGTGAATAVLADQDFGPLALDYAKPKPLFWTRGDGSHPSALVRRVCGITPWVPIGAHRTFLDLFQLPWSCRIPT